MIFAHLHVISTSGPKSAIAIVSWTQNEFRRIVIPILKFRTKLDHAAYSSCTGSTSAAVSGWGNKHGGGSESTVYSGVPVVSRRSTVCP